VLQVSTATGTGIMCFVHARARPAMSYVHLAKQCGRVDPFCKPKRPSTAAWLKGDGVRLCLFLYCTKMNKLSARLVQLLKLDPLNISPAT
jgi:hypothetical protein